MPAAFLPPPVPIGSLADYQETILGQWQQVQTPDSSKPVLEIPQASQILQPTQVPFEFDVYDNGGNPCDLSVSCTCVAHEKNTGAFVQIGGADIPPGVSDFNCLSWAQGPGSCQSGADNLNGLPLGSTFPAWFLRLFSPPLDPNAPMVIDYWTIVCDPVQIVIPNWKPPVTGKLVCPPPSVPVFTPNGFICMADPPVPNHLPRAFRKSSVPLFNSPLATTSSTVSSVANPAGSPVALKTELNVALRTPVPFIPKNPCGCGTDADDFGEELVEDILKVKQDVAQIVR